MIGQQVLHYKIVAKLGEGGMGVVYKAEDTRLKRDVAIKFLPADATDLHERFKIEAQAAAALNHPNIATIHAIEEIDDQMFIVMEYIDGRELKELIDNPAEDQNRIDRADIAVQIASGLKAAHEKGITHRDIKSTNIMITSQNKIKIMDFGLAQVGGREHTHEDSTSGTAAYMSPEQARGEKVDARSDIWSFGVVLYEMFTGGLPFKGDYEQAVTYAILNEEPLRVTEVNPDIPEEISVLIHQALAKNPDDRHATIDELLEALQATQKSEVIPPSLRTFIRQPAVLIGAAILVITLTAVVIWWQNRSARITWAHEQLPAIEQLSLDRDYEAAFNLASDVSAVIPDDTRLKKLWPGLSIFVDIISEPAGAHVYRKEYDAVESDWDYLGITSMDSLRIPRSFSRIKVEKKGFQTVEIADHTRRLFRKPVKLDRLESVPAGMVRLAGGRFGLALPGIDHLKAEPISDVFIDQYEVTNKSFKKFVDSDGYLKRKYWKHPFVKDGRKISWSQAMEHFKDKTGRPGPSSWEVGDFPDGQADYPVGGIHWYEAAAYAEFAGKSLPTVFHWSTAAGPWNSYAIVPLSNYSNGSAAVGSMPGMSRSGTYDMAGNVREWCYNSSNRPEQRFILGGGWNDATYSFNDAFTQNAFDRSPTNGFRCIKYIEPDSNLAAISRTIELPFRDFLKENSVSDETFEIYLSMFGYDKTNLNAKQESIDANDDDSIQEIISFDAAYGDERVTAYLFLPKTGKPPYQTVVIFPGSGVIHTDNVRRIQSYRERIFDFIIKSGRAVLFPIYKGTLTRRDELDSDYPDETNFWKDHVIAWVKDFSRSLDYLETRQDIDMQRLAYFGFSWGGYMGNIVPAVETRLKTAVLYVAGLLFQRSLPEVDAIHYVSRVKLPVLMLNGKYDQFFPQETAQKPMFQLLGTPAEHKRYVLHETGHFVPRAQLVKETLDWLDRYMGEVSQ